MKVLLAVAVLSLLVSCKDKNIDGMLKVFTGFTLTDEDGYDLSISEGTYEAEFSYRSRDAMIEMEIDDVVAGYDRDFRFSLANLNVAAVSYSMESQTSRCAYVCLLLIQVSLWMQRSSSVILSSLKSHPKCTWIVAMPI